MKAARQIGRQALALALAVPAAAILVQGAAIAAPVSYTFSTGANPFGTQGVADLFSSDSFVSGTFQYDPASPATGTTPTGGTFYGILNQPPLNPASYAFLAGTVAGFSFSDARGTTVVQNDNFQGGVDFLQLNAQSTTPTVGFAVGGYSLVNVRMFWSEGQQVPELVPDFLANQSLPGELPQFHGRLALDFAPSGNPAGPLSYVFFDGLSVAPVTPVPEPETYAMLLAGLGLLAFTARRRSLADQPTAAIGTNTCSAGSAAI